MSMPTESFWVGRKVLVTGHTGFKGSWLCLWLQALGAEVTGYALQPPCEPNLFTLYGLDQSVQTIVADIRDGEALLQAVLDTGPEIIIHMAAQPLVRYSYLKPAETFETNVLGTVHLLDAVRTATAAGAGIKAVINVTTDKCYENREWPWGYRENDRLGGFDPYSNSKACAELVTSSYRNSFFNRLHYASHGVSVATARAGNVIGGGDWSADRIVPDCMRALLSGKQLSIRNPRATRPWQHVLEPLQGYLLLAENMVKHGAEYAEAWNFGPKDESVRNVEWLVKTLGKYWGDDSFYTWIEGSSLHEAAKLSLDSSKARQTLDWKSVWNAEQALEMTVLWFQAYRDQADMKVIGLRQLEQYTSSMIAQS